MQASQLIRPRPIVVWANREIEHGIQGLQSFSSWGTQFIETYVISMIEGLGLMYQGAQEEQQ